MWRSIAVFLLQNLMVAGFLLKIWRAWSDRQIPSTFTDLRFSSMCSANICGFIEISEISRPNLVRSSKSSTDIIAPTWQPNLDQNRWLWPIRLLKYRSHGSWKPLYPRLAVGNAIQHPKFSGRVVGAPQTQFDSTHGPPSLNCIERG